MEFALSEEQRELAATVRSLLGKRADARVQTYDEALWQTLCEQIGVAALAVPEAYDGVGASLFETNVVLEELGRSLAPSPLLASLVTAEALLAGADEDAKQRLLPRIAAGEVAAFADGAEAVNVLDGDHATVLVVATDDGLFEVDPATAERTWTPSMDQTLRLASIKSDVGTATRIGDATAARDRARLVGAVGVTALAVGCADRALEMTVAYSRERVQFGRQIGSFQALKHRMADMLVLLEMSRSASWAASYAVATHADDAERLAHVAKAYCGDALAHIAGETVQLHGGIAITWEHDAQLLFKRAHALGQLFGRLTSTGRSWHSEPMGLELPRPLRVLTPADLVSADPTPGMERRLAFELPLLWAGQVETAPGVVSGWHHHDVNESSLYIVRGVLRLEFEGYEGYLDAVAGDYVHVPSYTVHRESNPGTEPSLAVITRVGGGVPTVNVDQAPPPHGG